MHYPLAVITKDGDYDAILAPYDASLIVAPSQTQTREEVIEEKRNSLKCATPDSPYEHYLKSKYDFSSDDALFESIKKDYLTNNQHYSFDEEGNLYTDYNQRSIWDWYSLGGRFSARLVIKDEIRELYQSTMFDDVFYEDDGYVRVNHAQIKDIDFIKTCESSPEAQEERARFWDVYVEGKPLRKGENPELYDSVYTREFYKEHYENKQNYLNSETSFPAYAILSYKSVVAPHDDNIFDFFLGKKKCKTCAEYLQRKIDMIASANPNDWMTIIDCHY